MFNEICINEEMLPKYTYIYIYIYIYRQTERERERERERGGGTDFERRFLKCWDFRARDYIAPVIQVGGPTDLEFIGFTQT